MILVYNSKIIHSGLGTYFGLLLTAELSRGCVAGTPKSIAMYVNKEKGQ